MSDPRISRRRFLILTGAALGACAMSCAGLGALSSVEDLPASGITTGFPELTLGVNHMNRKILVAYATAAGSTGGVAEMIGKTLAEKASVDVRPVQSITSLDGYDAVILGSAIHGGKWLPEAVDFLKSNQARLKQIPTAFFLVGMMANKKGESGRKLVGNFLAEERALVKPVAEGHFVGAMYTNNIKGLEAIGIHFFIAYCELGLRGGDYRDPAAIRAWTESTAPLLLA
jgi:menaquinone-dependent protoporphyrinogen oxidase